MGAGARRADPLRRRGGRLRPGRGRRRGRAGRRRDGRARTWSAATAGAAHPQGGGHRVPRLGRDHELADRGGPDARGAARSASGARRARGGRDRTAMEGGTTVRVVVTEQRSPGTGDVALDELRDALRRRLRHRLRRPRPDLDLPLHRRDPPGGFLPRGAGLARRRRRPRAFADGRPGDPERHAGRREPRLEARPGDRRDLARLPCSTPTRQSAIRPRPARSATRWPRPRCSPRRPRDRGAARRRWPS